jgi:hypothetical protein
MNLQTPQKVDNLFIIWLLTPHTYWSMELVHLSAAMAQTRKHTIFFKQTYRRLRRKLEDSINIDLMEVVSEDKKWTELSNVFSGWLWCYY